MFSLFQESGGGGSFHIPRTSTGAGQNSGENISNTGPIDRTEVKRIQQDVIHSDLDQPLLEARTPINSPKYEAEKTKKPTNAEWCQIVKKLKNINSEEAAPKKLVVRPFDSLYKTSRPAGNDLASPEARRVRFASSTTNIAKPTQLSRVMDDTIDTDTLNKSSSSQVNRRAGLRKFRLKSARQRELWFKELYWSRQDVARMKKRASKKATSFRFSNKVAVDQIERLFDDFCRKNSEEDDGSQDIDEENEEMLNYFLHDWAASDGRGLEEMAATTNMFEEGRLMAVESILAYQQMLQNMDYSSEEISMLLRARSESASRRARMFALYLALGDALVSAMDTESRRFVWISPAEISPPTN